MAESRSGTQAREERPTPSTRPIDLVGLAKRAAVLWSVGLLIILAAVGIGYALDALLFAFAGLMFALVLRSVGEWIGSFVPLGEHGSLAAAVLLLLSVLTAGAWLVTPSLAEQTEQLRQSLPRSLERMEEAARRHALLRSMLDRAPASHELIPKRRDLLGKITGAVSGTFEAVGLAVVVFFTGLYGAAQPHLYVHGFLKLVPVPKRDRARQVLGRIALALRRWLVGKAVSMLFVGASTWLGLWILRIDSALALAVLAALLTFIPNFGPIVAAVPAALLGLVQSPMTAVWVLGLYAAVQTIESYVLTPFIQQQTVALPPALTITTQLVMASYAGGIGLALATPLTVVVLILVQTLYVEDILGDASVDGV